MPSVCTGRPDAATTFASSPLVEAFAAERHEQRAADVGMRAELLHHAERVGVRIAAGEADQVHVVVAERRCDLARDVMRALDEVRDDQHVADALAAVGARVAAKCVSLTTAPGCAATRRLAPHPNPLPVPGRGSRIGSGGGTEPLPLPPQAGEGWGEGGAGLSTIRPSSSLRQHVRRQVAALHVVRVHVRAGGEWSRGDADRAVVLDDRVAGGDVAGRELVPDGDVAVDRQRAAVEQRRVSPARSGRSATATLSCGASFITDARASELAILVVRLDRIHAADQRAAHVALGRRPLPRSSRRPPRRARAG